MACEGLDCLSFFFQAKNRAMDEDEEVDDAEVLAGIPYCGELVDEQGALSSDRPEGDAVVLRDINLLREGWSTSSIEEAETCRVI